MRTLFSTCACAVAAFLFACTGEPTVSSDRDAPLVSVGGAGISQAGLKLFETSPGSGKGMLFEGPVRPGGGNFNGFTDFKIKPIALINYPARKTYGELRREGPEQAFYFDDDLVYSFQPGFSTMNGETYPTRFTVVSLSEKKFIQGLDLDARARRTYGLSPSQMFRGKVGNRIFFHEQQNPQVIFCRAVSGGIVTSYVLKDPVKYVRGVIGTSPDAVTFNTFEKSKGFINTSDFTDYYHNVRLSSFK